ncbi:hypothetical protein AC249_AIPGENE16806 [Exaiptasia diaphana]|nr:hypothetical protein AC249_AIPGENE16806 [Exaiptasia diaphana]
MTDRHSGIPKCMSLCVFVYTSSALCGLQAKRSSVLAGPGQTTDSSKTVQVGPGQTPNPSTTVQCRWDQVKLPTPLQQCSRDQVKLPTPLQVGPGQATNMPITLSLSDLTRREMACISIPPLKSTTRKERITPLLKPFVATDPLSLDERPSQAQVDEAEKVLYRKVSKTDFGQSVSPSSVLVCHLKATVKTVKGKEAVELE